MQYPAARRQDLVDHLHGHEVADPYRWLEDPASEETVAWLAAEDELWTSIAAELRGREAVSARMTELVSIGYRSAPAERGGRLFYAQRLGTEDRQQVWVADPDGTRRILLNPMQIREDGTAQIDMWSPSPDGTLLAYHLSIGGDEEAALYVINAGDGHVVEGPLERVRYGGFAWMPDSRSYYYGRRLAPGAVPAGEELFHRRVHLHRIGDDFENDPVVFGEGRDKTEYHRITVSRDGRWLIVAASRGTEPRNDLYIADLQGDAVLRTVVEGIDAQTGARVLADGKLYIHTDLGAPRRRMCVGDPSNPAPENWHELIPESPDSVLSGYSYTRDRVVATWSRDAVTRVTVHDRATGAFEHEVELPGSGSAYLGRRTLDETDEVYIGYGSFVAKQEVYAYDVPTRSLTLAVEQPGSVDLADIVATQVHYASKDGTDIPMFLVHRRDLQRDGARPTILYGYGGFNIPMSPAFSPAVVTWVEAGGVYALACLRGGSERGEEWHRAGMRERKQNVFDDFIAAAEWLIAEGYTSPANLGIRGGSNGGLLVTACLTQRPDLYAAVECHVPLCDMVRYEEFSIGRTWNDEYGTAEKPEELAWLLAYSPYHHVRQGVDYPAVLIASGNADARTDPTHARKMCAALQWATGGTRPVVFRREENVGHGNASVSRGIVEVADCMAFMAAYLGLDLVPDAVDDGLAEAVVA